MSFYFLRILFIKSHTTENNESYLCSAGVQVKVFRLSVLKNATANSFCNFLITTGVTVTPVCF